MAKTILADRAVIRLSGDGVRDFLQGLVTADVAGPLPTWAGLLTPQGKALFDFFVWGDGDDLLLDCGREVAGDLVKRLAIYRLRRPIGIAVDDAMAVHWSPEGGAGVPDPRLAGLGRRWLTKGAEQAPGADAADDYRRHRLRLGVTEGRAELVDILWLEANAAELNGVSFAKGCFIGQENSARMNWRSKVNRRLVVVETGEPGPRTRIAYPELGLTVEHRRVDDLAGALIPDWLKPALA